MNRNGLNSKINQKRDAQHLFFDILFYMKQDEMQRLIEKLSDGSITQEEELLLAQSLNKDAEELEAIIKDLSSIE